MNSKKGLLSGLKVLVVDDEIDLRDILTEDLELLGAEVQVADNGRDAFDLFVKHHPHGIISDIRMPGGDGIELLKKIRTSASTEQPCVFLITGFSDLTVEQAQGLGAQALLSKPFSLKRLRELMMGCLEKHSKSSAAN